MKEKTKTKSIEEIIFLPPKNKDALRWKLIKDNKYFIYEEPKRNVSLIPFACLLENHNVKIVLPWNKLKFYPSLKLFLTLTQRFDGNRKQILNQYLKILAYAGKETYGLEYRSNLTVKKIHAYYKELIEKIDKYGQKIKKGE